MRLATTTRRLPLVRPATPRWLDALRAFFAGPTDAEANALYNEYIGEGMTAAEWRAEQAHTDAQNEIAARGWCWCEGDNDL